MWITCVTFKGEYLVTRLILTFTFILHRLLLSRAKMQEKSTIDFLTRPSLLINVFKHSLRCWILFCKSRMIWWSSRFHPKMFSVLSSSTPHCFQWQVVQLHTFNKKIYSRFVLNINSWKFAFFAVFWDSGFPFFILGILRPTTLSSNLPNTNNRMPGRISKITNHP